MINKDSTFKEIKIFMDTIDEMTKDPSGTYWMSFSHNNVEYELYGTPNFLNNGELNFQLYIDEFDFDELDLPMNYKFDSLTKEEYLEKLNSLINKVKDKNVVRMTEIEYREILSNNNEVNKQYSIKEESFFSLLNLYRIVFKRKPIIFKGDLFGELKDMEMLNNLEDY